MWGVQEDGNQRLPEDVNGNGVFTKMEAINCRVMVTVEFVLVTVSEGADFRSQKVLTSTAVLVYFYTV